MDDAVAHRAQYREHHVPPAALACGSLFTRHGQLQHHGGQGEQHQRMHRDQGEERHQPRVTIGQPHQRRANGQRVAEHRRQRQHRRPAGAALPDEDGRKQDKRRHKIHGHRLEVELLHMHCAHGAKQQRRRQHHEHQVGQVFGGHRPDPPGPTRHKTNGNQQHNRDQGSQDGMVHKISGLRVKKTASWRTK